MNAKLKVSAMSLLSENFFLLFFRFFFLVVKSANEAVTGVCICDFVCTCVCIVQPERETLEEKPFTLPTDSPVSALTLGVLIRFPVTRSNYMGVPENKPLDVIILLSS